MRFRVFVSLPAAAAEQLHFLGRSGRLSPPQNKAPFQEPRFLRLCAQLRIAQIIRQTSVLVPVLGILNLPAICRPRFTGPLAAAHNAAHASCAFAFVFGVALE
jgi:hypothetical protein